MNEMPKVGYTKENLYHLPGVVLHELVNEMHQVIVGLLWQIDDLKNFDDLMFESHFEDTVPFEHAQILHRLLMTYHPGEVTKKIGDDQCEEFDKWWNRCSVVESFSGGE